MESTATASNWFDSANQNDVDALLEAGVPQDVACKIEGLLKQASLLINDAKCELHSHDRRLIDRLFSPRSVGDLWCHLYDLEKAFAKIAATGTTPADDEQPSSSVDSAYPLGGAVMSEDEIAQAEFEQTAQVGHTRGYFGLD